MSWDVIVPFLKPIAPYLTDPEVTDVMVNGEGGVFIEKGGTLLAVPEAVVSEKSLQIAVRNIARVLGDDVSPEQPILESRLPDGARVAAVLPPCAVKGTVLAIRKFHGRRYSADELVRTGTLPAGVVDELRRAVQARQNIMISGGTGTGKTTLLNALAGFIPTEERVIVIEDTSELQIQLPNLVRLEARREQPGLPGVTVRDLLRTTLRLRPDRILLGEVRGAEAFDLLQALNTGHAGTLATLHANSAVQAIARLTTCVLQSGVELPYRALRSNLAEAIHLLVHIERRSGRRQVTQIFRLRAYDTASDRYDMESLYDRN